MEKWNKIADGHKWKYLLLPYTQVLGKRGDISKAIKKYRWEELYHGINTSIRNPV